MSNFAEKLERKKRIMEEKLKERKRRNDALKNDIFDFPNITLPIVTATFFPAFIVLIILMRFFKGGCAATEYLAVISCFIGWFGQMYVRGYLEHKWFHEYGKETIIKEPIPYNKNAIILWIILSIAVIAGGFFLKDGNMPYIFFAGIIFLYIFLPTRESGIIWEMPPLYLLGFRKYKFVPNRSDNHAARNTEQHCVIQKKDIPLTGLYEGTYIGKTWFYVRKKYEEPATEEAKSSSEKTNKKNKNK